MNRPITISGAGCCLVDQIYPDIDFSGPAVSKYMSRVKGDGGLYPGRLVFSEQFEAFADKELHSAVSEISQDRKEPTLNVGGPSIVALIHASQLLQGSPAEVRFYGARGDDNEGKFLQTKLEQTPVRLEHFRIAEGDTPTTIVLSDPNHNLGHGERIFINNIGASWNFGPDELKEDFFDADIVVFGGTALVPNLHDGLSDLLIRAKNAGCITIVNTVYDFRNEFANPGEPWPLGQGQDSYSHIDLLIMDREEALHLSGMKDLSEAGRFFKQQGVASYIITDGTEDTWCYSDGSLFKSLSRNTYPVSAKLISDLQGFEGGDTTGAGDNFVGGILASLAWQMQEETDQPDLAHCIAWGTVSGGYCCFHVGGTFIEMEPGEKLELIKPYLNQYWEQINA
jgi:sugar/nucleoside kinase (ribokinase family)